MKIGIFGLGYVGLTTAACLLRKGHQVVGYEVSSVKRSELAAGRCPLTEPGVEAVLCGAVKDGSFQVANDIDPGNLPDVVLICVGTPSAEDGSTDLTAVRSVFRRLAGVALEMDGTLGMDVALRSTVPPGTLDYLAVEFPVVFDRFGVVFYPEFLREGTAMADFDQPPQTVVGLFGEGPSPERLLRLLESFSFDARQVTPMSAEALKMACNAFHAVKVCFANEIGRIIGRLGGDANEVMDLFVRDTVLNVSARYLRPGSPYGGSCLPKDVRSMCSVASRAGVPAEILGQCERSNASHLQHIVAEVLKLRPRVVALLGVAFKPNTDDLRESPSLNLASSLAAAGVEVVTHDFSIDPQRLTGVNQAALDGLLRRPGITLEASLEAALNQSDCVVLMHGDPRYKNALQCSPRRVVDVAGWRLDLAVGL